MDFNPRKLFRFRLKSRPDYKDYFKWFAENKLRKGDQTHHCLSSVKGRKLNGLLLISVSPERHDHITYGKYTEDEWLDDFIEALENLQDYAEYKLKEK